MSANEKQVGGKHYASAYQHWDWVVDCELDYLTGRASAYVVRWRRKNGVEDLKKAVHFVEKMLDRIDTLIPPQRCNFSETIKLVKENELSPAEEVILINLASWTDEKDLKQIIRVINELLHGQETRNQGPVPLTEENHYTERAGSAD